MSSILSTIYGQCRKSCAFFCQLKGSLLEETKNCKASMYHKELHNIFSIKQNSLYKNFPLVLGLQLFCL